MNIRPVATPYVASAATSATTSATAARENRADPSRAQGAAPTLTPEQQRQVSELQQIDRAVRAHEQAHISAGFGVVTSGANFSYTYGPDGKRYAVGGEVGIDTSAEKRPADNIDKGQRIQAAALAPRDPSPQDYKVAAIGSQLVARGQAELAQARREEMAGESDPARQRVADMYGPPAQRLGLSDFA